MKKNIIQFFGILLLSITTAHAFDTVLLHNATSCQVTINPDRSQKTEKVRAVDIFSFYYTSQDSSSRTYYSTIPANASGMAAVGDFSPGFSPPTSDTSLGYSPSPGYFTGGVEYLNYGKTINNWYIYQLIDKSWAPGYCAHGPCIVLDAKNPCVTHESISQEVIQHSQLHVSK